MSSITDSISAADTAVTSPKSSRPRSPHPDAPPSKKIKKAPPETQSTTTKIIIDKAKILLDIENCNVINGLCKIQQELQIKNLTNEPEINELIKKIKTKISAIVFIDYDNRKKKEQEFIFKQIDSITAWKTAAELKDFSKNISSWYVKSDHIDRLIVQALTTCLKTLPPHLIEIFIENLVEFRKSNIVNGSKITQQKIDALIGYAELIIKHNIDTARNYLVLLNANIEQEEKTKKHDDLVEQFKSLQTQMAIIGSWNQFEVRVLKNTYEITTQKLFAPKIPEDFLKSCHQNIADINIQFSKLKKIQDCKTLKDFTDLESSYDQIRDQMFKYKKTICKHLAELKIFLTADLKYCYKPLNITVHTELSILFDKEFGVPLRDAMNNREVEMMKMVKAFRQVDFGGIGDCLFRTLANVRTTTEGRVCRLATADYMSKNKERFQPHIEVRLSEDPIAQAGVHKLLSINTFSDIIECYCEWMRFDTSYGGEPEIQAFSDMHQTPLVVLHRFQNTESINTVYPIVPSTKDPLPFLNLGQAHFVRLWNPQILTEEVLTTAQNQIDQLKTCVAIEKRQNSNSFVHSKIVFSSISSKIYELKVNSHGLQVDPIVKKKLDTIFDNFEEITQELFAPPIPQGILLFAQQEIDALNKELSASYKHKLNITMNELFQTETNEKKFTERLNTLRLKLITEMKKNGVELDNNLRLTVLLDPFTHPKTLSVPTPLSVLLFKGSKMLKSFENKPYEALKRITE